MSAFLCVILTACVLSISKHKWLHPIYHCSVTMLFITKQVFTGYRHDDTKD